MRILSFYPHFAGDFFWHFWKIEWRISRETSSGTVVKMSGVFRGRLLPASLENEWRISRETSSGIVGKRVAFFSGEFSGIVGKRVAFFSGDSSGVVCLCETGKSGCHVFLPVRSMNLQPQKTRQPLGQWAGLRDPNSRFVRFSVSPYISFWANMESVGFFSNVSR